MDCFVGGTNLRNAPPAPPTASGTISVPSNVAVNAVFAQLFWVILADTPPPGGESLNGVPLSRIACGPVTPSPCWGEASAFAYRANVLGLLTAGVNTLTGFPDSGTLGTGPESEGASLVVAFTTTTVDKEIIVTCGNDAHPLNGIFFDNMLFLAATPPGVGADLHMIGADGQVAPDYTKWNGVTLDSPDAWQGLDPGNGVGYWDSLHYSVFTGSNPNIVTSGGPAAPPQDCINWVATVLCTKNRACQVTPVEPSTWGRIKSQYGNE